ncbi:MAG: ATP-binding cassette domain-containing protein, partial [Candidatus Rokubacteria bacterium]|nr:ATP-binding cassette domain-containing protein [Candidatus Rokubacteria bacterium]
ATLSRPSRGRASIAGLDCTRDVEAVRRVTAVVGHGAWVYDDLTALENLTFWATLAGRPAAPDALRAALAAVELEAVADARVRTFSAGMTRRLSLARATLGRPRVLLLDEPFGALDERGRKWLDGHLASFKAAGGAVLMATHSFGRGLAAADRAAILAGGRIACDVALAALSAEDVRRLWELHAEGAS